MPAGDVWRAAWSFDDTLPFYSADRFHPSELGTYAAAVTIAAVLGGEDPYDLPHRFATPSGRSVGISEVEADYVKRAAAALLDGGVQGR